MLLYCCCCPYAAVAPPFPPHLPPPHPHHSAPVPSIVADNDDDDDDLTAAIAIQSLMLLLLLTPFPSLARSLARGRHFSWSRRDKIKKLVKHRSLISAAGNSFRLNNNSRVSSLTWRNHKNDRPRRIEAFEKEF